MLNRFLLFAYDVDRSGGGWNDFIGSFATIEEVTEAAKNLDKGEYFYAQIVDITTGKVMRIELID